MQENESEKDKVRRRFIRKHWKATILFVAGAILVMVWAILVFLWVAGNAQATGMVPLSLGQWAMGTLVTFLLNLLFWVILLVAIPVIVALLAVWSWWKELPLEERSEYRFFQKRSQARNGGNGMSFLIFIAFCIKIYLDGNWNVAFSTWTFDYLVYSSLTALIWVFIIFGIPIAVLVILWVGRWGRTKP